MTAFLSEPKKDCPMCGGTGRREVELQGSAYIDNCPCTQVPDGDGPDD